MIQFDHHIFQMGWFNHQLEKNMVETGNQFFSITFQGWISRNLHVKLFDGSKLLQVVGVNAEPVGW